MGYTFPSYEPVRAKSLYGLSIAFAVITTLVLCLRFWSRSLLPKDNRFKSDDWTALAAWVSEATLAQVSLQ